MSMSCHRNGEWVWIRLNWRVDGSAGTIYVSRGQFGGEDNLRQFASDETPEAGG